ncbi:electron transport complex subunit RsxD [Colwellia sp. MB02u-18]|jgi:electron transport complex protein RnfD|uniref:electron transport complex subunit RsxD n=1 Tax=unclassified Colwellia TaxID=196834 RepID=UPI0015F6ADB0|nr:MULTISPECIES: electron transport complex subunit RsxD [unclassified Colwellia]MBA6225083.1 electron transport complex subunit RsxD [Colwellia sp. MB3u-45]MBA6268629.1 electron transport complex subunit RsxD [Colwellia sp. MB3u-43]MBA6290797.1 electron transport complex subunit RsxD [Colwellia sp. MB3u-8]MBA6296446.1 electron transport complex subunit RsxD [Colwellia sp. MB02u-9]MBA6306197.1 electron transport complex subunit RsxD [Colwellia sp. MB3u-70]
MAFWIASSPHNHQQNETSSLMRLVIYATIPGIFAQWYFFGWGNLIHISLAVAAAIIAEFTVLSLRNKKITPQLFDGSAILTAVLLGISLPALAPWWISVIGSVFAIALVKQLYGGLGHNPFNPAMAAYVMLLISFPLQMTQWQPPLSLLAMDIQLTDTLAVIFSGYTPQGYSVEQIRTHIDGFTMATPLDTVKTNMTLGLTVVESMQAPTIGKHFGVGWEWINAGFLLGGLFLLSKKAIPWSTPVSFLLSLFVCSFIAFMISPDSNASTMFHWFTGATMLGAFFILTDPVSGATSVKGRLVFGALAGLLVFLIRKFGGYPDAVAFAVLLCNMSAPLIDQYTRPRTYGHDLGVKK